MEYFGLELGQDLESLAAHPYQKFRLTIKTAKKSPSGVDDIFQHFRNKHEIIIPDYRFYLTLNSLPTPLTCLSRVLQMAFHVKDSNILPVLT